MIQHSGISEEISTETIQKVHESNIEVYYVESRFDDTKRNIGGPQCREVAGTGQFEGPGRTDFRHSCHKSVIFVEAEWVIDCDGMMRAKTASKTAFG